MADTLAIVDMFLPGHGDIGTEVDVLDEAQLLADFKAEVRKAIAAGKTKEEIGKLDVPRYAQYRNYGRRANFLEALHHLYTTGKPQFVYGAGQE